jgi:hypothetical protein
MHQISDFITRLASVGPRRPSCHVQVAKNALEEKAPEMRLYNAGTSVVAVKLKHYKILIIEKITRRWAFRAFVIFLTSVRHQPSAALALREELGKWLFSDTSAA